MGLDDFDWTLGSGSTPSWLTGPSTDHTTGSSIGNYIIGSIMYAFLLVLTHDLLDDRRIADVSTKKSLILYYVKEIECSIVNGALATTTPTATRTSSLNVNLRFCHRFATISSILT